MGIGLLVADDHPVIRAGIGELLEGTDITVLAEASHPAEVFPLIKTHSPDIVLMDVRLGGTDGLELLGRIKRECPDLPVLMFTNYDNPFFVTRALAMKASGYLMKNCRRDEFINTIRTLHEGGEVWVRSKLRSVSGELPNSRGNLQLDVWLTRRELEVLRKVASGLTNNKIARVLEISPETVKEHVEHILHKVGVEDRTQAAVWATRMGVV